MNKKRTGIILAIILCLIFNIISIRPAGKIPIIGSRTFIPFERARPLAETPFPDHLLIPFAAPRHAGYLDPNANQLYALSYSGRIAIDAAGWIRYDRFGDELEIEGPRQHARQLKVFAYPWFGSERRLLLRADQMALAEISADGTVVWDHEFPMIITALDASRTLVASGFLDGSLAVVDEKGAVSWVITNSSEGAIDPVYGLAVSRDGT
ncbi:MAG: hypothetical protein N3A02_03105, partial [Rectinema sp.]|nr:hypothetical protein [Rectinema sp.]